MPVKSGVVRSVTFFGASRLSGWGLGEWRGRLGDPLPADRKFREVRQRDRCERPLGPQLRPDLPCLLGDEWTGENRQARDAADQIGEHRVELGVAFPFGELPRRRLLDIAVAARRDRKSTRLNSSHVRISYAVFCLKKKKKQ